MRGRGDRARLDPVERTCSLLVRAKPKTRITRRAAMELYRQVLKQHFGLYSKLKPACQGGSASCQQQMAKVDVIALDALSASLESQRGCRQSPRQSSAR